MKKKISFLLVLTIMLFIPINVFAISGSVTCSPGNKTVTVGETFTITISGRADAVTDWAAAGVLNATGAVSLVGDGGRSFFQQDSSSFSKTYSIKANSVGTGSVNQYISYTVNPETGQDTSVWSSTCNITVVAANSSNSQNNNSNNNSGKKPTNNTQKKDPNKNSNTNLKRLNVVDVELSPEFNKDTLEYSVTVEGTVEKINIEAEAEEGKSYVEGAGEKDLQEGLNEFYIYVTAENGDVKEYKVNITRKEKNPIEVTIDGKKYTVVKKETEIEIPEGFEKETITIDDEEVVAYSNENITSVLVVLVDEEGNTGLFAYNAKKNTYTRYIEFKTKEIKLMILESKSKIPFGYKKISFTIDGKKVDGFYFKKKDRFRLVYGINMETGDEGYYQYDLDQKTFQRYNDSLINTYYGYAKKGIYVVGGVLLLIIILLVSVISLSSKNRKIKKGNKELPKKEVVKELPKKEVKPDTKKLSEKEMDEILSRTSTREGRRLQKEVLKKQKEEAKDFLK